MPIEEIYTLLDGTEMTTEELVELHKDNLRNNTPPYIRYFCSKCNYEVGSDEDGSFVCFNCKEIIT